MAISPGMGVGSLSLNLTFSSLTGTSSARLSAEMVSSAGLLRGSAVNTAANVCGQGSEQRGLGPGSTAGSPIPRLRRGLLSWLPVGLPPPRRPSLPHHHHTLSLHWPSFLPSFAGFPLPGSLEASSLFSHPHLEKSEAANLTWEGHPQKARQLGHEHMQGGPAGQRFDYRLRQEGGQDAQLQGKHPQLQRKRCPDHHGRRADQSPHRVIGFFAHLFCLDHRWTLVPPSPLPPSRVDSPSPSPHPPSVLPHHQGPAPEGHCRSRTNPLSIQLFLLNSAQVPREGFGHQPLHGRAGHEAEDSESS